MSILTAEVQKEDNLFKRLFWPSNHPNDVDTLGQQGFWICLIVGLISGVVMLLTGHLFLAILMMVFMILGGIGVREHSVAAAILVAGAYLLNIFISMLIGRPPGALDLLLTGLLLANIRGTYIAAAWQKKGALEEFPDRLNTTFFDILVDQLPAKVWPTGRFVFYAVSAIYILLLLLGAVAILIRPAQPAPNSVQLQVQPSNQ